VRPQKSTEIFSKVGVFLVVENYASKHRVSAPNHHNFTTKTPAENTTFSKTTLKKGWKNRGFSALITTSNFFLKS
jgi:hypothetical protein